MKRTLFNLNKMALATGLCLSLAACQHTAVSGPTASENILRNEVKMVRLPFRIQAEEDGTATPSDFTLNGIHLFLNSVGAGQADVIMLDAPDAAPERVQAVAQSLRNAGLVYGGTSPLGTTPAAGEIMLYVERYVVTPPNCGTWKAERSDNDMNNASAHHGCSTVANLGLMVANPRDLIAGQSGGNSTAAAVGALYTPAAPSSGPTMTLSLDGLGNLPSPASSDSNN